MKGNVCEIDIDEALEILWTLEEQGDSDKEKFKEKFSEEFLGASDDDHKKRFRHGYRGKVSEAILNELEKRKLVKEVNGDIRLTEKGHDMARDIVRRHRLAERLFVDMLDMGKEEIEKPACEFEHLLSEDVTDRICTLLGHPRECPHGLPIPEGKCCTINKETIEPAIIPLPKVETGKEVEVAYIHTKSHSRIHKLLSYDIGPGSTIEVHQKDPVFIIRSGETDIALEKEIIKDIYVKPLD